MKLWLLTRTDNYGWDEYIGFVVRAPSASAAKKLVVNKEAYLPKWKVTEIKISGEPEIIFESFHAG